MKTLKFLIFTAVITASAIIPVSADNETLSLKTIAGVSEYAVNSNLDIKEAGLAVLKARNSLSGIFKVEESSISLSTGFSESEYSELETGISAELPLIDQLGFSFSVDDQLNSSIRVSINPLYHSSERKLSDLSLRKAELALNKAVTETVINAAAAYMSWSKAIGDKENAESRLALMKQIYEDERVRYNEGEATLDDVREALLDWSESRTSMNTASQALNTSENELYSILNTTPEAVSIEPADRQSIESELTRIKEVRKLGDYSADFSYEVLSADIDRQTAEAELKEVWLFSPELSASGGADFSQQDAATVSASVSIGLSSDSWNAEERSELKKQLELSSEYKNSAEASAQLSLLQLTGTIETAAINTEISAIELEQAGELKAEAEFLFEQGEYSNTELDDAVLAEKEAEAAYFGALADELGSWMELSLYSLID